MGADDFNAALRNLDMPSDAFARITGSNPKSVARWRKGQQDIPPWVPVLLAVLLDDPGNVVVARRAAAAMIRRDNEHPERGEYPYLKGGGDDE